MDRERVTFWVAVTGWGVVAFGSVVAILKAGPLAHYAFETDREITESELRSYCPENAEKLIRLQRGRDRENIRNELD